MMQKIFKTAAILSLAAFVAPASAEPINGWWNPVDNSADVSWQVNSDGFLVITIDNTSNYSGMVTGFQFELDDGSTIDHLVDVDGTSDNSSWGYTTDARGCFTSDCMLTGNNFWRGDQDGGIAAGTTAEFRFFGDFVNLTGISDFIVRFQGGGRWGRGNDGGWGCYWGCGASEVPEPGTLVLFGIGLVGFAIAWRRRQIAEARS